MTTKTQDKICWHCASLLSELPHGMFCRHGGVSKSPFTSLNLSYSVGDSPEAVTVNRQLIKQCVGLDYLVSAVQVHGDQVLQARDVQQDKEYAAADALITQQRGVGLLIQQADCQAVLLYDPAQEVIAAVHSGWKGSVLNIIAATVRAMQKQYGTNPHNLRAVISPSLGPCCAEFINWRQELPTSMHRHQVQENYFDFWAISREQLVMEGVQEENIETIGICTACNQDFFSYRRAVKTHGKPWMTGRCGSIIALPI